MATREEIGRFAEVLEDAVSLYDDHVFEKMRIIWSPGNNLKFEWDDVSEDDVKEINRGD